MSETPYIYCFVRKDIPNVHAIVQTAHAGIEMALQLPKHKKPKTTAHLVLLQCTDKRHLMRIKEKLDMHEIDNHIFFEPDDNMGYTALATEPIFGENRKLFERYKLYE